MSDNWIVLVPHDAEWTPTAEAAQRCIEMLLRFFPRADQVTPRFESSVSFFGADCDLEGVSCPNCGHDAQNWWIKAMNKAWETRFADLSVTTPCCGTPTSLNDLCYHWPAAFGRFALEVRNPGSRGLSREQHQALELCLGSRLHTIWRHL